MVMWGYSVRFCSPILLIFTKNCINYDMKRHGALLCDKVVLRRREKTMQKLKKTVKKAIANMAKKTASMEANTACPCMNFQPKEPQDVNKLRNF